mmetsp:Transcript_8085/g.14058  ORF Transcript_8085/g.14058 Transcript_8085/m.14058 type:complete len:145 (-) Transcript_8085:105-539(-)
MTHARLFLGWVVDAQGVLSEEDLLDELHQITDGKEDAGNSPLSSSSLATPSSGMVSLFSNKAKTVRIQMWKNVQEWASSESTNVTQITQNEKDCLKQNKSPYGIFPTPKTESAAPILQYILWLRSERKISPNYEANIMEKYVIG